MKLSDLSELYQWIRKNNQHTPDDVVDFMYEAAKEKFKSDNTSTNKQSTSCFHEGDLIPFAAYRECQKCGAIYTTASTAHFVKN